jgi:hypothetical protein
MNSELWWHVARAGGFLAWGLSAFSILWGLLITSRALGKRISGPRLLDLHRFIGGLSVVFVFVHILGLRLSHFNAIPFGGSELFVPMASKWHPGAVAYGIVAFYLLIAVEITSLLRHRIPASVWRSVHYGGFVVFLLGSIHALKVGTDVQDPLIWWPSAVMCAAIVGLAVTRAMSATQEAPDEAPELEIEIFDTNDSWAMTTVATPAATPTPPALGTPSRGAVTEALATTAHVDDNRAQLLERTRQSLERLDITAYPRAELPPELLTTRPVQTPAAPVQPEPDDMVLPTRPAADIALRYARLRNPTNPPAGRPPSFQAHIPLGAHSQSNWGQPPAGWDAPSATPPATEPPVVEPASDDPIESVGLTELPAESSGLARSSEWATSEAELGTGFAEPEWSIPEEPAPAVEPAASVGLPDPTNRTAWEDQQAAPVSSLDWRTPARSIDPHPITVERPPDRDDEAESTLVNVRSGLPARTPQRLARSTQPARNALDWKPQRLETMPMGGAPPPPTPDPVTGEVPSEQYRVWLREWLAFAESYEG